MELPFHVVGFRYQRILRVESIKLNIPVLRAYTFWKRFRGFMLKKSANYALLFDKCKSVHTFFMRFNLDIVYLDEEKRIIKVIRSLKPFKIALPVKNAVSILEIPSGIIDAEALQAFKKLIDF